jgi:calcineurin-like phosphoesterase family protein
MIYFTADLHLGHANIIRHCSRPFASVSEMDAAILAAINAVVQPDDTLWILGDFAYRGRNPHYYRYQIACRDVRMLLGNHDRRSKCEEAGFSSVGEVAEITVGKQRIWMSHYPHRAWPASHRGSWHLYGHVHGRLEDEDWQRQTNALDVGVDADGPDGPPPWTPWSLDDVARVLPRVRPPEPPHRRRPAWMGQPYWVDPPSGWRYGFPKLYDPAKDGNVTEWMIRSGYPESLARQGLPCTMTSHDPDGARDATRP